MTTRRNVLHNRDCIAGLRKLDDGIVDLAFGRAKNHFRTIIITTMEQLNPSHWPAEGPVSVVQALWM